MVNLDFSNDGWFFWPFCLLKCKHVIDTINLTQRPKSLEKKLENLSQSNRKDKIRKANAWSSK